MSHEDGCSCYEVERSSCSSMGSTCISSKYFFLLPVACLRYHGKESVFLGRRFKHYSEDIRRLSELESVCLYVFEM